MKIAADTHPTRVGSNASKDCRLIDPFAIKRFSRVNPYRAVYTAWARFEEWRSLRKFASMELPWVGCSAAVQTMVGAVGETAVTPEQYTCLLECLGELGDDGPECIVEVGAYRGVTTEFFSRNSSRPVYAVDPYVGYGGSEEDLAAFRERAGGLPRVTHLREPSGDAARRWGAMPPIGLLFIDAIHNYVSTRYDLNVWRPHILPGGFVALHDVDQKCFAGTRRAAFEAAQCVRLFRHVPNLAILQF